MLTLPNNKHVLYSGQKLKPYKLASIMDYLYTKSLLFDKHMMPLNSEVMRKQYGTHYNYYIKYLLDNGYIRLVANYSTGRNSNIYAIRDEYLKGSAMNIMSIEMPENKANSMSFNTNPTDGNSLIDPEVRLLLTQDLNAVTIDFESAMSWLDHQNFTWKKRLKSLASICKINETNLYWSFDIYGRMHTNFTVLKREIRKEFLYIDGEQTDEVDIGNSQPMFLYLFMRNQGFTKWQGFDEDVLNESLYDKIMNNVGLPNRKEAKTLVYKILFGRNDYKCSDNQAFYEMYPRVWEWISSYKIKAEDHCVLSHFLQREESNFIYNTVIKRIKKEIPDIKIFTVHDSISCQAKYKLAISEILNEELYNIIPEKYMMCEY
jgi:hypothetical protein